MKKSQDIIGLPVFSIIDGKEVGQVKDLVINPDEGAIEFLMVNSGNWYVGAQVLPFRSVAGIGQHAVTTESEGQLVNLNESANAAALLQRGIKVKGTKVLTRKGNLVGVISEYEVDENTGRIASLEFRNLDGNSGSGLIKAGQVLTYGKDVLVVEDKVDQAPLTESAEPEIPVKPIEDTATVVKENEATRLFIERQKQFLLGKRVTRDVKNDEGTILIPEGTIIDDQILNTAEINGKLVELSQNAK
jgi:uncharacterized protein YrrD